MIELVEKVHVQKNEGDEEWYGTYKFRGIREGEVEKFVDEIAKQTKADIGSVKGKYDYGERVWPVLLVTLKGFSGASEGEYAMEDLKRVARAHKMKGQRSLTEEEK